MRAKRLSDLLGKVVHTFSPRYSRDLGKQISVSSMLARST